MKTIWDGLLICLRVTVNTHVGMQTSHPRCRGRRLRGTFRNMGALISLGMQHARRSGVRFIIFLFEGVVALDFGFHWRAMGGYGAIGVGFQGFLKCGRLSDFVWVGYLFS